MTPHAYKAGGANSVIAYATAHSSLGKVLVAATGKGICAVLLGDDGKVLVADLKARFPKAAIAEGDKSFQGTMQTVIENVETPKKRFELPLDVQGTAFQHKVWKALCQIPPGETLSYAEIAKKIGQPGSVRAVATACAANPVAILIPCHRVVRSDGALSGYRWGIERKRSLLDKETAAHRKSAVKKSRVKS